MAFLLLLGGLVVGTVVWLYHPAKRAGVGGVIADVFIFTGELVSATDRSGSGGVVEVILKGQKKQHDEEELARIESSEGNGKSIGFLKKASGFTWVVGGCDDVEGPAGQQQVVIEITRDDEFIADGKMDLKALYKAGVLRKEMDEMTEIRVPLDRGVVSEIIINGKLAKGSNFHEAWRFSKSVYHGVKRAGIFGIVAYGLCAACGVFGNFMVGGMFLFGGCTSQSIVALVGMVLLAALVLPTVSAWSASNEASYAIARDRMFLSRVTSQLRALVLVILGLIQITMSMTGGTETCSPLFATLGFTALINALLFIIVFIKDEAGGDFMALVKPNCLTKSTSKEGTALVEAEEEGGTITA
ncbi:hypothetical protein FOL47_010042 [Perkinsus chesapeaki]|uniref:Uncharacterized protein n=1 Tax=Perkinsus chesapeaki TaxID=330153 RepID=A0A7J6L532_PERCH|nr:hypothetical protein FOL47_010042 [Perkinsus chesapeaki]